MGLLLRVTRRSALRRLLAPTVDAVRAGADNRRRRAGAGNVLSKYFPPTDGGTLAVRHSVYFVGGAVSDDVFAETGGRRERDCLAAGLDFVQVVVVGLTTYLYFFYVPSRWAAEGPQLVPKILQVQTVRDAALGVGFAILAARIFEPALRAFFGRMSFLFVLASTFELAFFFTSRPISGQSSWNDLGYSAPYLFAAVAAATWKREAELVPGTITRKARSTALTHLLPVGIPLLVQIGRASCRERV